jgi:hypothetical protein
MLSRHERQRLRDIEKSVEMDDPDFAARLSDTQALPPRGVGYRLAAAIALVGMLTALVGLLVFSPLLMFGGACLAINGYLRVRMIHWAEGEPR